MVSSVFIMVSSISDDFGLLGSRPFLGILDYFYGLVHF